MFIVFCYFLKVDIWSLKLFSVFFIIEFAYFEVIKAYFYCFQS